MSEHGKLKRIELADGVGYAIDRLVSRAADTDEFIFTGKAVQHLLAEFPDAETTPVELAEAVIRAAAAKGLAIAIQGPEQPTYDAESGLSGEGRVAAPFGCV